MVLILGLIQTGLAPSRPLPAQRAAAAAAPGPLAAQALFQAAALDRAGESAASPDAESAGNCTSAIPELQQVLDHAPPGAQAWDAGQIALLTACLWTVESEADVERLLLAASAAQPDNVQVLDDLSALYRNQRRFPEAIALLENALALRETAEMRWLLAAAQRHMANSEAVALNETEVQRLLAAAEMNQIRVGELDPDQADLMFESAAVSMLDRGEYARGAHTLERALSASLAQPDSEHRSGEKLAHFYLRLGEAFIRAGEPETGAAYLDYAVAQPEAAEYRLKIETLRAELLANLNS